MANEGFHHRSSACPDQAGGVKKPWTCSLGEELLGHSVPGVQDPLGAVQVGEGGKDGVGGEIRAPQAWGSSLSLGGLWKVWNRAVTEYFVRTVLTAV